MIKALLLSLLLISSSVFAECDLFYPNGKKIQPFGATELCNVFYVTQYDEANSRALFSSELLSPGKHDVPRRDAFRGDARVRPMVKPQEYYGSGYDKGHLVPADDANTPEEMHSTFLMTNMTPQNPKLNRGSWRQLEMKTRDTVDASGKPARVVTGAIYGKDEKMQSVPIPSGYYKILYVVGQKPVAYYANNTEKTRPRTVNISWVNARTGLKFPKETE